MRYPAMPYRRATRQGWEAIWAASGGYADDGLRRRRAEAKAQHLRSLGIQPERHTRVLEVGSGKGLLATAFAADPNGALLLDWSHEALRSAVSCARRVQADVRDIPLQDRSVDLIIAACVLEHVENRSKAVAEIVRVMAPGATLCVIFSHRRSVAEVLRPLHRLRGTYQCGYMRATFLEEELQPYLRWGLKLASFAYLDAMADMPVSRLLDSLLSRRGLMWSRYVGIRLSKPVNEETPQRND